MKWFKHYTDASRSEKLAALMDKTGIEGYGRYWLLVEFLAEKFDGKETEFLVNKRTLGRHLGYYRPTMARHWLDIGHTLGLFQVSMSGQCHTNDDSNYLIVFPKLLEIKDNHTKNLQVTTKSLAPRTDKNRIDKSKATKTKSSFSENLISLLTDDEIITWCKKTGTAKIQEQLYSDYDHSFLKEEIKAAYYWQLENKIRKAGTFLSSWMKRSDNPNKINRGKLMKKLDAELINALGGDNASN